MRRMVWRRALIVAVVIAFICAMVVGRKPQPKKFPPNDDPWIMVSYKPDAHFGTYLGNGLIACRIKGDGVGSQDGNPLPCFMAGLYDDEKLIPTPTWSDLRFYDGKTEFRIDPDADYKQTLNMKTGILTTKATWRAGRKSLKGEIEVIVLRQSANVGVLRAKMVPSFDGEFSADLVIGPPDGRLTPICKEDGTPHQLAGFIDEYVTKNTGLYVGYCISANKWIVGKRGDQRSCSVNLDAKSDKKLSVTFSVAVAMGEKRGEATLKANSVIARLNRTKMVADHKAAWAKLWKHDIFIDGPKKDQQALHSCMFYLLQSVREGSEWSIPPLGLSDNGWNGHVFWDADVWMFPALILQHPELAKSIVEYRYKTLPGAIANAKASGNAGAEYAWESGYTGKEDTAPGLPYRYERHINGDVALAQWQYYLATNDLNWLKTRGYPVIKATADYWTTRATFVPAKDRYEILKVVPPDENAEIIDNSAYTNVIAQMNLRIAQEAAKLIGEKPNPNWAVVADKMYIPFDRSRNLFTTYDNYKGFDEAYKNLKAKQADTELIIYPLQYQMPGVDMNPIYRSTFSFYAPRVMEIGPAMTSSVHSVISARFGELQQAYAYFLKSYRPYIRGPFNYFNEKPSKFLENMCFLTGAAGPIQATIFGMAGMRMDYFGPNAGKLSQQPHLPKQWKSLKITGVQWRGKTFDVAAKGANKGFSPFIRRR